MRNLVITTVDSYQGMENDLVLVSLVRSNEHGVIGFLNVMNRVCVALSRARYGMYLFGNKKCITKAALDKATPAGDNKTWLKVLGVLERQKAVGPALPLVCQQHGLKTKVKSMKDWDQVKEGGCSLVCNKQLHCGHHCQRNCHPY